MVFNVVLLVILNKNRPVKVKKHSSLCFCLYRAISFLLSIRNRF